MPPELTQVIGVALSVRDREIQVDIIQLDGTSLPFAAAEEVQVEQIKALVEQGTGMPSWQQLLVIEGTSAEVAASSFQLQLENREVTSTTRHEQPQSMERSTAILQSTQLGMHTWYGGPGSRNRGKDVAHKKGRNMATKSHEPNLAT